jgi:hypothetical protein
VGVLRRRPRRPASLDCDGRRVVPRADRVNTQEGTRLRRSRSSAFLRAVDALCDELQHVCGLTRFSIVVERVSGPLTITLQDELHSPLRRGVARIDLELRDSKGRIGEVLLEDALAQNYPQDIRAAAGEVVRRHLTSLRDALPE